MPSRAKSSQVLSKQEQKFVTAFEGDQTDAARKANYKNPAQMGSRLMQRKRVRDAIRLKQDTAAAQSGKEMAKRITITRSEIINRLDKLSLEAESDSAKVSALCELVAIFGLRAKDAKTDVFAGWNDEELQYYRNTGEFPPSRGSGVGQKPGPSGTG